MQDSFEKEKYYEFKINNNRRVVKWPRAVIWTFKMDVNLIYQWFSQFDVKLQFYATDFILEVQKSFHCQFLRNKDLSKAAAGFPWYTIDIPTRSRPAKLVVLMSINSEDRNRNALRGHVHITPPFSISSVYSNSLSVYIYAEDKPKLKEFTSICMSGTNALFVIYQKPNHSHDIVLWWTMLCRKTIHFLRKVHHATVL